MYPFVNCMYCKFPRINDSWFLIPMRRWPGSALVQVMGCSAPSHYMNQCWLIVNWTLTNKLRWILDRYTKHFIHENAIKNVVYEMAVILSINTLGVQICAWWRHQMETFSALLAICAGNSPVPVNSPHKGQWRGALMFTLICARINGWVNNREAGDLRRYRAHYDVIVMCSNVSKRFRSVAITVMIQPFIIFFFILWGARWS